VTIFAERLHVPRESLTELCRRYHVRRLALFGSVLRADFTAESDIDMLVEFEPGRTPGLAFFTLQDELSALFGRPVDLNTLECLSPYFRDEVASEAEDLYVAP
jgi:predicted nucleotidyltransferase